MTSAAGCTSAADVALSEPRGAIQARARRLRGSNSSPVALHPGRAQPETGPPRTARRPDPASAERPSRLDRPAPRVASVATALPPHAIAQADAKAMLARLFAPTFDAAPRLLEVSDHTE